MAEIVKREIIEEENKEIVTLNNRVRVIRPLEPRKEDLENFYDVCNRLFTEEDGVFYEIGECKKLGMKAI